jgi:uncharacterized membrane protein YoaK (UPF0700 family)
MENLKIWLIIAIILVVFLVGALYFGLFNHITNIKAFVASSMIIFTLFLLIIMVLVKK